jgi:hypothetical protein
VKKTETLAQVKEGQRILLVSIINIENLKHTLVPSPSVTLSLPNSEPPTFIPANSATGVIITGFLENKG